MHYNKKIDFKFVRNMFALKNEFRSSYDEIEEVFYERKMPNTMIESIFYKYVLIWKQRSSFDFSSDNIKKIYEFLSGRCFKGNEDDIGTLISDLLSLKCKNDIRKFLPKYILKHMFKKYTYEVLAFLINFRLLMIKEPPLVFYNYHDEILYNIRHNFNNDEILDTLFSVNETFNLKHFKYTKCDIFFILKTNYLKLLEEIGFQDLYIYGSYIIGNETEYSDVDLLIEFPKETKITEDLTINTISTFKNLLPVPVDICIKNENTDTEYIKRIMKYAVKVKF